MTHTKKKLIEVALLLTPARKAEESPKMTSKAIKPLRLTAMHLENWRNFTLADVA